MEDRMADERFSDVMQQERDRLNRERDEIFNQQRELENKLTGINREFAAIEAYEAAKSGKVQRQQSRASGARRTGRRGSKREGILQAIKEAASGLSRGELLEKLGLKG